MKPTFRLHFSDEHPTRPGLWVSRKGNFIGVLQVDASDIERNKREANWLDGEWGAQLELVPADVVPMDRKAIQEHLDQLITTAAKLGDAVAVATLQDVRTRILGVPLVLTASDGPPPPPGV